MRQFRVGNDSKEGSDEMEFREFQQFLRFLDVEPSDVEMRAFRFRVLSFLLVITITFATNFFYVNEEDWLLIDSVT